MPTRQKEKMNILSCMVILFGACIASAGQITINTGESKGMLDNWQQNGVAERLQPATANIVVGDTTAKAMQEMFSVMQLPTLAAGEHIDTASISFKLVSKTANPTANVQVDVFFKNVGTLELSDYGTTAVASMTDFVTQVSVLGVYKWSDSTLASALDGVYSGKTTPSFSHVVFRLRWTGGSFGISDGNATSDSYNFAALANATVANRPTLTLTSGPIQ